LSSRIFSYTRRSGALALALALVSLAGPASPILAAPTAAAGTAIAFGTYLNGTGQSIIHDIAVDDDGFVYVVGETNSVDFPVTAGALQGTIQGYTDGFVAKLAPSGSALVWATYLGSAEDFDRVTGVAVGEDGSVYVAGLAGSGLPLVDGLQAYGGNGDAFLSKIDPTGSQLLFSTYLGGDGFEYATGIAVEPGGVATMTASAYGDISTIPTLLPYSGDLDIYVAKIDTNSASPRFALFLGGASRDDAGDVTIDSSGSTVVVGATSSFDFPLVNAYQTEHLLGDAVVVKLDSTGGLAFSTLLGGGSWDNADHVGVDAADNVYVAGSTLSDDFPTVNGQFAFGGYSDAFVAKLDPTGATLVYSTTVGGNHQDQGYGFAVTPSGSAATAVWTSSSNYPLVDQLESDPDGDVGEYSQTDIAVTKLTPGGDVEYSTYVSGTSSEEVGGVAADAAGNVYVGGTTQSMDFPVTTGAYQSAFPGADSNSSAVVVKLSAAGGACAVVAPADVTVQANTASGMVAWATGVEFPEPTLDGSCEGVSARIPYDATTRWLVGVRHGLVFAEGPEGITSIGRFEVNVPSPYTVCLFDSVTHDRFQLVVDATSPIDGVWWYLSDANVQLFSGTSTVRAGKRGTYTAQGTGSGGGRMRATGMLAVRGRVVVSDPATGTDHVLNDQDVTDNPGCW
jgi:hypothetical protein